MKANDIAKWFLIRDRLEQSRECGTQISNLKLQKLLYYAQGVYLAVTNKPLFEEDILAWKHGPVVDEVYQEYKANGSEVINYNPLDDDYIICREIEQNNEIVDVLEFVFNEYSCPYTAWKLRNMTHEERPWKETWNSNGVNNIISNDLIREYFLEEVVEV